jgi:hypothetical protein
MKKAHAEKVEEDKKEQEYINKEKARLQVDSLLSVMPDSDIEKKSRQKPKVDRVVSKCEAKKSAAA